MRKDEISGKANQTNPVGKGSHKKFGETAVKFFGIEQVTCPD